jgi:hypothetical protein
MKLYAANGKGLNIFEVSFDEASSEEALIPKYYI